MTGATKDDFGAAAFAPLRPRLVRLAYRMLGTRADAEDVVQEAFLRWMKTDRAAVRTTEAYLHRIVARLCLDHLRAAKRQRDAYVGPWLPEPILDAEREAIDDITLPLMLALERLSPLERAAFLLHDVFDIGFDEIAAALGRDAAACRQLASRARAHLRAARPRFSVSEERGEALARAFHAAASAGDIDGLRGLLTEDVVMHVDGGGQRAAAKRPLVGREDVLALLRGIAPHLSQSRLLRATNIDGLPGFISMEADGTVQTTALDIGTEGISGIYIVRNPHKLLHIQAEFGGDGGDHDRA